jgi:PAS domain S-box-containing protein
MFAAAWAAGWVMETAAVGIAPKIFWVKFQAIWQTPLITLVTCFCLEYAWPGRWLTHRNLILFSIPCILSILLILTDHLHHLVWNSLALNSLARPQLAPGSLFLSIYFFVVLGALNLIIFGWLFYHSPQHRWPVVIMLFGQIMGRALYLMDETRIIPYAPSLSVPPVAFEYLMYAIALFGFRIFDPIPLARQAAIEQMHAGVLVLDHEGKVVSQNPAAERFLGVRTKQIKGKSVQGLLSDHIQEALSSAGKTETEYRSGEGEATCYYTISVSHLQDFRGLEAGRLLMLQDVTGEKRIQAQILEQERALAMLKEREQLARELHDNLGQVFAFVNAQGQAIHRLLEQGDLLTADEFISRLINVAHEADVDIRESILALSATLSSKGFISSLTEYLVKYERNYAIHAQLEGSEAITDVTLDPLAEVQLLRILQEALTNVRKHAGPCSVQIAFAREDGYARVTIQDNGQGFDATAHENDLPDHMGLRVMRERAEEMGGSLALHSEPGQGTELIVQIPVRGTVHA